MNSWHSLRQACSWRRIKQIIGIPIDVPLLHGEELFQWWRSVTGTWLSALCALWSWSVTWSNCVEGCLHPYVPSECYWVPLSTHRAWIGVAAKCTWGHRSGSLVSRAGSRGGVGPEYAALIVGYWSCFRGWTCQMRAWCMRSIVTQLHSISLCPTLREDWLWHKSRSLSHSPLLGHAFAFPSAQTFPGARLLRWPMWSLIMPQLYSVRIISSWVVCPAKEW